MPIDPWCSSDADTDLHCHLDAGSIAVPDLDWLTVLLGRALERRSAALVSRLIGERTLVEDLSVRSLQFGPRAVEEFIRSGGMPAGNAQASGPFGYRYGTIHLDRALDYPCIILETAGWPLAIHVLTARIRRPAQIDSITVISGSPSNLKASTLSSFAAH